jgi:hypothetical protein
MRNRRRRYALVSNLGIAMLSLEDFWHHSERAVDQLNFNDAKHRLCSLGSVGSEVGRHKVHFGKRGSEALDVGEGADLRNGEEKPW